MCCILLHTFCLCGFFYFLLYSLWCCRCRYHPPSLLTRRIIFYPQKCIPKNPGRSARSCIQWLGCPRNGNKKLFFIHEAKQQFETFILFFFSILFLLFAHSPASCICNYFSGIINHLVLDVRYVRSSETLSFFYQAHRRQQRHHHHDIVSGNISNVGNQICAMIGFGNGNDIVVSQHVRVWMYGARFDRKILDPHISGGSERL